MLELVRLKLGSRSDMRAIQNILALALVLASALSLAACARLETVNVLGRILALEGEATLLRKGEPVPRRLTLDQRFAPGDIIRAEPGAKITVSPVPGVRATLLGGSELSIVRLEIRKSGEAVEEPMRQRRVELHLSHGAMYGSLAELEEESESLVSVTTSAGKLDLESGAVFSLRSNGESSHVVCAKEQVNFTRSAQNDVTALEEGQSQEFGTGGVALPPNDVQNGSGEAEEIELALEAERQAVSLERREQNQIPTSHTE